MCELRTSGMGGWRQENITDLSLLALTLHCCVFAGNMMNEGLRNNGLWNDGCPAVAESSKRVTGQEVFVVVVFFTE